MFSFSTSSPFLHHLDFIHLRSPHVSCFMLTPFLPIIVWIWCPFHPLLHCYAFFISLNLVLFFSLFLWWKDALDIIIPSSAGREISSPPLFRSYPSYLYPSSIYHLPPAGSWTHPFSTVSRLSFLFTVTYLTYCLLLHYLLKSFFSFFFVVIKFLKNLGSLFLFSSPLRYFSILTF